MFEKAARYEVVRQNCKIEIYSSLISEPGKYWLYSHF